MAHKQINVRLPDEVLDVYEAAAYVRRSTLADLARELLLANYNVLRQDEDIKLAMEARARAEATRAGKLSSIEVQRRRKGTFDGE